MNVNLKKFEFLIKLCKMSQDELMEFLPKLLKKYGYKSIRKLNNNYIYAKGDMPIMLVAHLDTVHDHKVKDVFINIEDFDTLSSPQGLGGDDRCGIYIIYKLIKKGYNPSILFVCDEEIGCLGARMFCRKYETIDNVNFIVEFDRRGNNDVVRYEDGNEKLTRIIEKFGFEEAFGSCSDISYLAPHFKVSAVNISSGYYHEHYEDTTIVYSDVMSIIERFEKFLNSNYINEKIGYIEEYDYHNNYYYNKYAKGYYGNYNTKHIEGFTSSKDLFDYTKKYGVCEICNETVLKSEMNYMDGLEVCEDCERQYAETLGLVECEYCGGYGYETDEICQYCGYPYRIDRDEVDKYAPIPSKVGENNESN